MWALRANLPSIDLPTTGLEGETDQKTTQDTNSKGLLSHTKLTETCRVVNFEPEEHTDGHRVLSLNLSICGSQEAWTGS